MINKLILVCTLLLSGCAVSQNQINKATELCKDNGGIRYIYGMANEHIVDVKCSNGALFKNVKVQR